MTELPGEIGKLFEDDPTRELEEVQKVNAVEQAESDIDEFYETPSSAEVLSNLGGLIERHRFNDSRFLYIHATFGSGKTHLLKLIGFATGEMGPDSGSLATKLANQFDGFLEFRDKIEGSSIDHLVPVFLNLLDRDATREPPLPMVIYEAIGRELGFPTDPEWLLAWVWEQERQHPGLWDDIQEHERDGQTFEDALQDRGAIRSWLYEALPEMPEGRNAGFEAPADVRESIQDAEEQMDPGEFGPERLIDRVQQATSILSERRGGNVELLLGLDEVALFIGDSQERYEEFRETISALVTGPNPVIIIGTGQWPPRDIHESFLTEADPPRWFLNHVELRGADTEIIVRKRWLRKKREFREAVKSLTEGSGLETLDLEEDVEIPDPNPVESYPFRKYDLWLLREVMQNLLGRGLPTEHEHIQGRALLVVVRTLFTRYGWDEKTVGSVVTWDQIFDLLATDEALIPSWAVDLIDRIDTTLGQDTSRVSETAKTLYLLNRTNQVPATTRNIARLLVDSVDEDLDSFENEVSSAVALLEQDRYIYEIDKHDGEPVYELLSREEVTLQEKIGRREPSRPQLRNRVRDWLQDHAHLLAEGRRHEVDLGEERKVPIRYEYSVLRGVQPPSTPPYDAVGVRVLAAYRDIEEEAEQWKNLAFERRTGEDLLVLVELSESFVDRLARMMATRDVLSNETQRYRELERSVREDERDLEQRLTRLLRSANIMLPTGERLGTFGESFERGVVDRILDAKKDPKFPNRKVLEKGLQEISDARALDRFFRGDGPWPLERSDASMLGVNTTTRELEGGWCEEFLDTYGDKVIVEGDALLDQLQERGGNYLGTPLESLAALLLTLATAREIELKRDGRPIREPDEMGRALRTKEDLRKLEVRTEPPVDSSKAETLRSIHRTLLDTDTSPDDPDEALNEIAEWTRQNSRTLREVNQQLAREFSGDVDLERLLDAIGPAMQGEDLDSSRLADEAVKEQVERFDRARALFKGPDRETWARFHDAGDTLTRYYPRDRLTSRVQSVRERDDLPAPSRLESMQKDVRELRSKELTAVHRGLTGTDPSTDDPDEIPDALSDWLRSNTEDVTNTLDSIEEEFSVELSGIRQAVSTVQEGGSLGEGDMTDPDLRHEVQSYRRARELLDDRDGTSLWRRLEEKHRELKESHPDADVTARVERVLTSTSPPDPGTVERLIEEAETPEKETPDEGVEALWRGVESLEPGSIVLIDPKEETE